MEQKGGNTMSQVDIYRRIMATMASDEEVVALCRKYIDRSESSSNRTAANLKLVDTYMKHQFFDESHTTTAKNLAAHINEGEGEDWSCRKASTYLTRLYKEQKVEKVVVKGSVNEYYYIA